MALTKMKDGVRVELTPEEEKAVLAERELEAAKLRKERELIAETARLGSPEDRIAFIEDVLNELVEVSDERKNTLAERKQCRDNIKRLESEISGGAL